MSRGELSPAEALNAGRIRVRGDLSALVAAQHRAGRGAVTAARSGLVASTLLGEEEWRGHPDQQDHHPPLRSRAFTRLLRRVLGSGRGPGVRRGARTRRGLLRRRRPARSDRIRRRRRRWTTRAGPRAPAGARHWSSGCRSGTSPPPWPRWPAGAWAVRPSRPRTLGTDRGLAGRSRRAPHPPGRGARRPPAATGRPGGRPQAGHRRPPRKTGRRKERHHDGAGLRSSPSTMCSWPCRPVRRPTPRPRPSTRDCSDCPASPNHPSWPPGAAAGSSRGRPRSTSAWRRTSGRPARPTPPWWCPGLDDLCRRLDGSGHPTRWTEDVPGKPQWYVDDPFGNRIELIPYGPDPAGGAG